MPVILSALNLERIDDVLPPVFSCYLVCEDVYSILIIFLLELLMGVPFHTAGVRGNKAMPARSKISSTEILNLEDSHTFFQSFLIL